MDFTDYFTYQETVCLDLKNATSENLYTWFSVNETIETTRLQIDQIVKDNATAAYESAKIENLYLQGDHIIAKSFENYNFKLEMCAVFMDELKNIPLIENDEAKKYSTHFMDNFMKSRRCQMSEVCFLNLMHFQETNNTSEFLFLNQTIAFDIANYKLRLDELFLSGGFKPIYSKLKRQFPTMKILSNLIVQKMYYHNRLPVAFSAKLLGTDLKEQWFWSGDFEYALQFLEPVPLAVPESDLSLNGILDKINDYGLPYLTVNEITFLEDFK